ncbi:MAG: hypothetical protein AAFR84_10785 [Pseudomonadota bacterium]
MASKVANAPNPQRAVTTLDPTVSDEGRSIRTSADLRPARPVGLLEPVASRF